MPQCPADGCDYSGEEHSVAAHYSGKKDDKHNGGYERAIMEIEQETKSSETKSKQSTKSEQSGQSTQSTQSTKSEQSEGVGEGLGIPGGEGDGSDGDPPESCPECGGDLYVLPEDTVIRLDSGEVWKSDNGDAACVACEALVTADGEVKH